MANLKVSWVLPTTRTSTKPLNPADIDSVTILLSADGGQNYGKIGDFSDTLETTITELEPGTWFVQGIVNDILGKSSLPLTRSYNIPDHTPPSALLELTLSL
jgi:hypothetical protein